jgi:hypothetical protein
VLFVCSSVGDEAKYSPILGASVKGEGRRPNRCYVNLAWSPPDGKRLPLDGIKVLTSPSILPDHFWVGVGGQKRPPKQ